MSLCVQLVRFLQMATTQQVNQSKKKKKCTWWGFSIFQWKGQHLSFQQHSNIWPLSPVFTCWQQGCATRIQVQEHRSSNSMCSVFHQLINIHAWLKPSGDSFKCLFIILVCISLLITVRVRVGLPGVNPDPNKTGADRRPQSIIAGDNRCTRVLIHCRNQLCDCYEWTGSQICSAQKQRSHCESHGHLHVRF